MIIWCFVYSLRYLTSESFFFSNPNLVVVLLIFSCDSFAMLTMCKPCVKMRWRLHKQWLLRWGVISLFVQSQAGCCPVFKAFGCEDGTTLLLGRWRHISSYSSNELSMMFCNSSSLFFLSSLFTKNLPVLPLHLPFPAFVSLHSSLCLF